MIFSWFVLLVALCLSAVAAYYSIVGLAAIFAAAVIPIVVMGSILEVAKITVTVWLHQYWPHVQKLMRVYLVSAVAFLMLLTSMGIFGFLSKAHTDQALVSGDAGAKLAIIDEKIKIERENIANARAVIQQMDAAVTGVIATGDQEIRLKDGTTQTRSAAERSLQIRRSQARDRDALTQQIEAAQTRIVRLQEESAPMRAEFRKVEAEVGPIKYIAALIYGDNPDTNLLERAVRWVIIIIVAVFDPLAVMMVLAATESMKWHTNGTIIGSTFRRHEEKKIEPDPEPETPQSPEPEPEKPQTLEPEPEKPQTLEPKPEKLVDYQILGDFDGEIDAEEDAELRKFFQREQPAAEKPVPEPEPTPEPIPTPEPEIDLERPGDYVSPPAAQPNFYGSTSEYINYEGKLYRAESLRSLHPELFVKPSQEPAQPLAPQSLTTQVGYGPEFPLQAQKGDQWVRTSTMPTRVYKFNGTNWIELDKNIAEAYSYDDNYISYLIDRISTGEYDPELLSDNERDQIEQRLKKDLA